MADGGVDFGRDRGARNVGVFPGRDLKCAESRCAESGCFPGSTIARRTVVPLTNSEYCILDYNCIITRLKC